MLPQSFIGLAIPVLGLEQSQGIQLSDMAFKLLSIIKPYTKNEETLYNS